MTRLCSSYCTTCSTLSVVVVVVVVVDKLLLSTVLVRIPWMLLPIDASLVHGRLVDEDLELLAQSAAQSRILLLLRLDVATP